MCKSKVTIITLTSLSIIDEKNIPSKIEKTLKNVKKNVTKKRFKR